MLEEFNEAVTAAATAEALAADDARGGVDWRRNLVAVATGQFAAIFGLSFTLPFLPLFLAHDLGVHKSSDLALWSGVATAALGLGLGISGPVWGVIADRYGRKPMLIRAMIGGSVTVALMGLSRNPIEITIFRFLFGLLSGTAPVAIALVAAETPRARLGWALGLTSSAIALGSSLGPAAAGLVAGPFGLRASYYIGAVIEGLAIIPIILLVKESKARRGLKRTKADTARSGFRGLAAGTLTAIVVLLVAQALFMTVLNATQPLVVLQLIHVAPATATFWSGIAFSVAGAGTAVAGLAYSRATDRIGYRQACIYAAALMAVALVGLAAGYSIVMIMASIAVFGLMGGVLSPAISSMMGLESPAAVQAAVFGLAATSNAVGLTIGPLIGGSVAAILNPGAGLLAAAGVAAVLIGLMVVAAREPSLVPAEA